MELDENLLTEFLHLVNNSCSLVVKFTVQGNYYCCICNCITKKYETMLSM